MDKVIRKMKKTSHRQGGTCKTHTDIQDLYPEYKYSALTTPREDKY